ncbi:hypothetical protein [Pedobacter cryoconitis]|uniref:Uncharacterized protein n=1 Tax=Pedobacter cryoconitis TaxID=188932 RepID=A0A327SK98_9SPHI|nr:hypothetical protein [Pedobacter cryoconitis]RAJ28902.1 hypothetical protein LY11_03176 [Pedobacter cryoconitis]
MKATHLKNQKSDESLLMINIESDREKAFLLSLFSDTYKALEAVNNPGSTHVLIDQEKPFTHEETKEILDKLYCSF